MPVYSALQAIDIFVLPSLYEGLPNVLLEAGAAAKPIVATRVGGVPDLIEDKRHGLLTPPKDPRALRDAIITLLEDENYATLLGKAIQKRVREEFSLTFSVEKYSQLYLNFYDKMKKYASEYNR
jgi:glycosyltransferase involved in cell wall biosynthesis